MFKDDDNKVDGGGGGGSDDNNSTSHDNDERMNVKKTSDKRIIKVKKEMRIQV